MLFLFHDEIYDFWNAWARESSGLGIVIKNISEKHIKNVLFCEHVYDFVLMIWFIFFYFLNEKNMFFV